MKLKKVSCEEFHKGLNEGEDKVTSFYGAEENAVNWIGRISGRLYGRVLTNPHELIDNKFEYEIFVNF